MACTPPSEQKNKSTPFDRFERLGSDNSPANPTENGGVVRSASETDRQSGLRTRINRCGRLRHNCVVDGDTVWLNGVKIRIADIDTPEISQPKCRLERQLGEKATNRLVELLNEGPFEVTAVGSRDEDNYGRKLRVLSRNGQSLGAKLVQEGLAHNWGGERLPWC